MLRAMTDFDLDQFLPYRLSVVAGRVSREFAARYSRRSGLSIPEWRVMAHLSQDDAVSVRELHLRADLEKSKASRAAAKLETAGLVIKRTHPADKRLVELSLTEKGRSLMSELIPLAVSYEAEVLKGLSSEDREVFNRVLSIMMQRDTC